LEIRARSKPLAFGNTITPPIIHRTRKILARTAVSFVFTARILFSDAASALVA
jgi:hypothetical protein